MIPDATTTSTPAPQAAAPGPQPTAPASPASANGAASSPQPSSPVSGSQPAPAPQPTPVQLLWEVAYLAFGLMTRLVHVLQPIQQCYPKPALLLARVLIDIPRILLTIRYAPERVTTAQLRHLTRARHILQALFNYTLPTPGTPISRLASAAPVGQSPSASTESATPLGPRTSPSATTPSPAISAASSLNPSPSTTPGTRMPSSATSATSATPSVRQVPEIPMVAGVSHVPASSTVNNSHFPPDPSPASPTSHDSQDSHPSHFPHSANPHSAFRIQHSAFSPYIPDVHTLLQALKSDSLPPNCAGALFEEPGEALVKALHQLHAIYFSLYPNQSPSPSQSQSSVNPQSSICNPQSGTPQSDAPFVHSVHNVHSVHPASPVQSEISNLKSEIPVPHSTSPP